MLFRGKLNFNINLNVNIFDLVYVFCFFLLKGFYVNDIFRLRWNIIFGKNYLN